MGGWCWRETADILRAQGHLVFAPTLTGLGERVHLRSPDVGLSTHIEDIVNVIKWHELNDVILVGHSYGGSVITGVCDAVGDHIGHLVYLDSGIIHDGETNIPGATRDSIEAYFGPLEDGYLIKPMAVLNFGLRADRVSQNVIDRFKRRLTPQPVNTYLEPLRLKNGGAERHPKTYILCTADRPRPYSAALKALLWQTNQPGWQFREIETGHNAMTLAASTLANLLTTVEQTHTR